MRKVEYLILSGILLVVLLAAGCNRPIPGSSRALPTPAAPSLEPLALTRTSLSGQIMATLTAAGGSPVPPVQTTPAATIESPTTAPATAIATSQPSASPQATEPAPPSPTATSLSTAVAASASPAAPVTRSSQQAPPPAVYELHRDEFPWCLARRYDVNPRQLLRVNNFFIGQIFYPGQLVYFPANPKPFPGERMLRYHPASYRVFHGDNIYSIACFFGDVDPLYLAEFNGISPPYRLKVGQILQIP